MIEYTVPTAKVRKKEFTYESEEGDYRSWGLVTHRETKYVCDYCNNQWLHKGDKFCSKCGRKLNWRGVTYE